MGVAVFPRTGSLSASAASAAAAVDGTSCVRLSVLDGASAVAAILTGTWSGTLQFEAQAADQSWYSVPAVPVTGGALVTSATANGNFIVFTVGAHAVQVRCSTYTSGTPTIALTTAPTGGFAVPLTGTATGASAQQVQGAAASGANLAGNPVLLGGSDGTNAQSLKTAKTDGTNLGTAGVLAAALHGWDGAAYSAALVQSQASPNLRVALYGGTNLVTVTSPTDALVNGNNWVSALAGHVAYDDVSTQWNRWRNNTVVTAFASAARTSTPTAANITNYNSRGLVLFVDVTAGAVALSLTPSITLRDSIGATAFTIWTAAAAITSTSAARYVYLLYPGSASAGSWTESVQIALPRQLTINMTHGNANSATYSVTVHTIL